jgi:hypothetical protein
MNVAIAAHFFKLLLPFFELRAILVFERAVFKDKSGSSFIQFNYSISRMLDKMGREVAKYDKTNKVLPSWNKIKVIKVSSRRFSS